MLISKRLYHQCSERVFPLLLLLLTVAVNSHTSPKMKHKILVYNSPSKQWKALLVRTKNEPNPKQNPSLRQDTEPCPEQHCSHTDGLSAFWFVILFNLNKCTRIWHDKQKREWSNSNLEFNWFSCREFRESVIPYQWNANRQKLGNTTSRHQILP